MAKKSLESYKELKIEARRVDDACEDFRRQLTSTFYDIAEEKGSNEIAVTYHLYNWYPRQKDLTITKAVFNENVEEVMFYYKEDEKDFLTIDDFFINPKELIEIVGKIIAVGEPIKTED